MNLCLIKNTNFRQTVICFNILVLEPIVSKYNKIHRVLNFLNYSLRCSFSALPKTEHFEFKIMIFNL